MTDPTENEEAGEIFQRSMQKALAHIENITRDLERAQEKVIDDQLAVQEELKRIERDANIIAQDFLEKNRIAFEEEVRQQTLLGIAKRLIFAGRSAMEIIQWLDLPKEILAKAWEEIGFTKVGDHVAHVAYEQYGRTGNLCFYREDVMVKFPFEFAGGNTLAFIEVPTEEYWEKETSIPLQERMDTLNFIGERVLRDQASGYAFEIMSDQIRIIGH